MPLDRHVALFRSFIKYGLMGAVTVLTQAIVFVVLADWLRVSGLLSYAAAVGASLLVAYFGQSRWAFAERTTRSPMRYLVIVALSFCVGSGSTWLIVDCAKLSPHWALPIIVFVIPVLSFFALRAWVFRKAD